MSVLLGLAYGCKVVSIGWVMRSLEVGHWLCTDDYEISLSASPVANRAHLFYDGSKLLDGRRVYIGNTAAGRDDVQMLVELLGGVVVKKPQDSALILGDLKRRNAENFQLIQEKWLYGKLFLPISYASEDSWLQTHCYKCRNSHWRRT